MLQKLRQANINRQKEWGCEELPVLFKATELGGEVGEALNVIKKLERERLGIQGSRSTINDLAEELGDIVICVDLIASFYDIDLASAVQTKFNRTSQKIGLETRIED